MSSLKSATVTVTTREGDSVRSAMWVLPRHAARQLEISLHHQCGAPQAERLDPPGLPGITLVSERQLRAMTRGIPPGLRTAAAVLIPVLLLVLILVLVIIH